MLKCSNALLIRKTATPSHHNGHPTTSSSLANQQGVSGFTPVSGASSKVMDSASTSHSNSADALAAQKKRLLQLKGQPKAPPPKPSCRQRLRFYMTALLALVLIGAGTAFLFVVPFFVDPALSTLLAEFVDRPVACLTTRVETACGLNNCTWTSCREGCTADAYNCTHIHVRYTSSPFQELFPSGGSGVSPGLLPASDPDPFDNGTEGALLVNVKGCGFPPEVDCKHFRDQFATEGIVFPCYYSKVNQTLVLPHYDRQQQIAVLSYSLVVPLGAIFVSLTLLVLMHSSLLDYCQTFQSRSKVHDQRPLSKRMEKSRKRREALSEPT